MPLQPTKPTGPKQAVPNDNNNNNKGKRKLTNPNNNNIRYYMKMVLSSVFVLVLYQW